MTECSCPFTREEMFRILPVVLSDLKHSMEPERRVRNNANIRRSLYFHVIREMYGDTRFKHKEPVEAYREGMFIKGYVRDVWSYLDEAYDLIHGTDFERDFADLISSVQ